MRFGGAEREPLDGGSAGSSPRPGRGGRFGGREGGGEDRYCVTSRKPERHASIQLRSARALASLCSPAVFYIAPPPPTRICNLRRCPWLRWRREMIRSLLSSPLASRPPLRSCRYRSPPPLPSTARSRDAEQRERATARAIRLSHRAADIHTGEQIFNAQDFFFFFFNFSTDRIFMYGDVDYRGSRPRLRGSSTITGRFGSIRYRTVTVTLISR